MTQKIDQKSTETELDEFMNDHRAAALMELGSRVSKIQKEIEQTKLEIRLAQRLRNDIGVKNLFENLKYWVEELNLTLTDWAES